MVFFYSLRIVGAMEILPTTPSETNTSQPLTPLRKRSTKRQTIPATFWFKPEEKAAIAQLALQRRLSLSATGRALVKDGMKYQLEHQQGALFEETMRKLAREREKRFDDRFAALLVYLCVKIE